MADRIPPSSIEAEKVVIGAALVSRDCLELATSMLEEHDFYAPYHEAIWHVVVRLAETGAIVDKISVAEQLRNENRLEQTGGIEYLSTLSNESLGSAQEAEYYCAIVREKALLRGMIHAGNEIASIAFDGEMDVPASIARAEAAFSAGIDRGKKRSGGKQIYQLLKENYARLLEKAAGTVDDDAILTPYAGLNDLIGAVMPGELVVWPAAPKSGKSANLFQIGDHAAAHYGAVMLASCEMSEREVAMRYAALYGGVSVRRQRKEKMTEVDLAGLACGAEMQKARPLFVYDLNAIPSLADIRRELRLLSRNENVRVLCLDGMNFLSDVDASKGDRSTTNDRMDLLYRSLLRIAKEFDIVVHAVQHLNREGQKGQPTMSDIRGGGNPEGHAHAIVAPYRPTPNGTYDERKNGKFIVLAAREGETGVVDDMEFIGARSMWLETHGPFKGRPWFEPAPVEEPAQMEFV